jgi:DNA-binding response OmpR family regulator
LLIEDNPGDARLIQEMLAESGGDQYVLDHADRLSTGLEKLSSRNFDAVLLDLMLPDSRGLNTAREVLLYGPSVPIIILSGLNHELLAYQALTEGVQDYLVKGLFNATALLRALRHAIARQRLQSTVHGLALLKRSYRTVYAPGVPASGRSVSEDGAPGRQEFFSGRS